MQLANWKKRGGTKFENNGVVVCSYFCIHIFTRILNSYSRDKSYPKLVDAHMDHGNALQVSAQSADMLTNQHEMACIQL